MKTLLLSTLLVATFAFAGDPIPDIDVTISPAAGGAAVKTVKTDRNGKFVCTGLPNGAYSVKFSGAGLKLKSPSGLKFEQTITVAREASTGMATGREAAAGTPAAPRDAATGQASGKRQHKPMTVRKDMSADGNDFTMTVTVDGDAISGMCTLNTSRSNIKK